MTQKLLGPNSYVTIILTKRCSLKCNYCFEDAGPLEDKDWDIDTLARCLKEARDVGYQWVAISGGDPPTHRQFNDVLTLVEESGLNLFLETNGVLVSEALAERLGRFSENRELRIQTSLDSVTAPRHDKWRGRGAHIAAIKGIKKFVSQKIAVHVCKVVMPDDFTDEGFNLDRYIQFCKGLGVARVEVVRSVPMGRGGPDEYRVSQDQLKMARTYLEALEDYGTFVVSTHFNHLKKDSSSDAGTRAFDAQQCRRLSGADPGIVINPDTTDKDNWKVSPCAFLQDIELGQSGDLRDIVEGRVQKRMEGIRAATMTGFEPETVWGCTECRPRFLKVLNEMRALRIYESARGYDEPISTTPEDGIIR